MEGLDGKVTIFHMAHKGDLRQVQALIQDDPRYLLTKIFYQVLFHLLNLIYKHFQDFQIHDI